MSRPIVVQLAGPSEVSLDRPRLMLLSYHFPPGQAPGALRWQMLAGCAAEQGLSLDVLTVHPRGLPGTDERRLLALPPDTRVFGIEIPDLVLERLEHVAWRLFRMLRPNPQVTSTNGETTTAPTVAHQGSFGRDEIRFRASHVRSWMRAYGAWREARRDLAWAREAVEVGELRLQPGLHRAVISCGPPHMPHVAASWLAGRAGIPFIMDLRDPWRLQQRLPEGIASPLWFRIATRHERRCVARATLVVTNTKPFRDRMRALYPETAERIISVMNGYDDEAIPVVKPTSAFVVAYAGSIYLDRDPRPLIRAGARVIREEGLAPHEFRFEFIGNTESYGGVPLRKIAEEEGIGDYVVTGPPRPRAEAMRFLAAATLLVSLPQDSDLAIPSKVFEYLNFKAWVLALATPESATGKMLAGTDADLADPEDLEAITEVLRRRWRAFAAGERPVKPTRTEALSRRVQARVLFDAIEQHIGN